MEYTAIYSTESLKGIQYSFEAKDVNEPSHSQRTSSRLSQTLPLLRTMRIVELIMVYWCFLTER